MKCKPSNLTVKLALHWYVFRNIIKIPATQNVVSSCWNVVPVLEVTHCAMISYLFAHINVLLWNHVTTWTTPSDFTNHGSILNWLTAVIFTVKMKSIIWSYRNFPWCNLMTQGGLMCSNIVYRGCVGIIPVYPIQGMLHWLFWIRVWLSVTYSTHIL